jgi:hypothetical protein
MRKSAYKIFKLSVTLIFPFLFPLVPLKATTINKINKGLQAGIRTK